MKSNVRATSASEGSGRSTAVKRTSADKSGRGRSRNKTLSSSVTEKDIVEMFGSSPENSISKTNIGSHSFQPPSEVTNDHHGPRPSEVATPTLDHQVKGRVALAEEAAKPSSHSETGHQSRPPVCQSPSESVKDRTGPRPSEVTNPPLDHQIKGRVVSTEETSQPRFHSSDSGPKVSGTSRSRSRSRFRSRLPGHGSPRGSRSKRSSRSRSGSRSQRDFRSGSRYLSSRSRSPSRRRSSSLVRRDSRSRSRQGSRSRRNYRSTRRSRSRRSYRSRRPSRSRSNSSHRSWSRSISRSRSPSRSRRTRVSRSRTRRSRSRSRLSPVLQNSKSDGRQCERQLLDLPSPPGGALGTSTRTGHPNGGFFPYGNSFQPWFDPSLIRAGLAQGALPTQLQYPWNLGGFPPSVPLWNQAPGASNQNLHTQIPPLDKGDHSAQHTSNTSDSIPSSRSIHADITPSSSSRHLGQASSSRSRPSSKTQSKRKRSRSPSPRQHRPVLSLEDPFRDDFGSKSSKGLSTMTPPPALPVPRAGSVSPSRSISHGDGPSFLDDVLSVCAPEGDELLHEHNRLTKKPSGSISRNRDEEARDDIDDRSSIANTETVDAEDEELPIQFNLSSAIEAVRLVLKPEVCPVPESTKRPPRLGIAEKASEKLLTQGVGKPTPPVLPLSPLIEDCFSHIEKFNKDSSRSALHLPKGIVKTIAPGGCYRPPAIDESSQFSVKEATPLPDGLDRAEIPNLAQSKLVPATIQNLYTWEGRDKVVLGAASQLDFLLGALVAVLERNPDTPELELLKQLTTAATRTVRFTMANAVANVSELLRLRRSVFVNSSKKLLDSSKATLLSAPLMSGDLFGGRLEHVVARDKEDQLHLSAVRSSARGGSSSANGRKRLVGTNVSSQAPQVKKQKLSSPISNQSKPRSQAPPSNRGSGRGRSYQNSRSRSSGFSSKGQGPPRAGTNRQP